MGKIAHFPTSFRDHCGLTRDLFLTLSRAGVELELGSSVRSTPLPAFGVRLLAFRSAFRPAQNSLIRRVCLSRSFSLSRSRGASSRFSIPKPKLNVQLIPESARRKSCGTPQFANLAADSSTGTQTSGLDPRMSVGLIAFGRRLMWLETRVGDRGWPNSEIVGPSF